MLCDNHDGTSTGEYKVEKPGDEVDVTLHGDHIKDAPFRVNVKPSADPSKSYAEGQGLNDPKTHFLNKFTEGQIKRRGTFLFSFNRLSITMQIDCTQADCLHAVYGRATASFRFSLFLLKASRSLLRFKPATSPTHTVQ